MASKTNMKITCSCGFSGVLSDLLVDDNYHRVYYCPNCKLYNGIKFKP